MTPEADIAREDSTPTIIDQAKAFGWTSGYYNFGKLEGDGNEYFNPALIERPDGLWLLVRRSEPHPQGFRFGQNKVWAFMLDETGTVPKMGKLLKWPIETSDQHFEDPRAFYHPGINQTFIGACTFIWYPDQKWTGAHQCVGAFDADWVCRKMDYPKIGGNPGQMQRIEKPEHYEKNWLFFLHDGRMRLLYKANPWLLIGFGNSWNERTEYRGEAVTWKYGDIRGGTTPIRVGDLYYTFHHSSLPWKSRYRRYYAGCLAFDAKPPFTPRLITPEPILRGSQNDPWVQRKPPVIFPCGAIYRNGRWLISCGVNDMKSAWVDLDHESLVSMMKPLAESAASIFSANGLSAEEARLQRLRTSLAKARAAKAEKRSTQKLLQNKPVKTKSRAKCQRSAKRKVFSAATSEQTTTPTTG